MLPRSAVQSIAYLSAKFQRSAISDGSTPHAPAPNLSSWSICNIKDTTFRTIKVLKV